jgi:hypothetical protein
VGYAGGRLTIIGYARGIVKRTSGTETKFGRIIGEKDRSSSITIKGYYSIDEGGVRDQNGNAFTSHTTSRHGTGHTTSTITDTTSFGFDFTNVWKRNGAGKWPTFR